MPKNVRRNVQYCLQHFKETNSDNNKISGALGLNISTIKRWRKAEVDPHESHLADLVRLVNIPRPWFNLPHPEFIARIDKIDAARVIFQDYATIDRKIILRCVEKWKHRSDECFQKHVGSYYMYSRLLTERGGGAAISLLRIIEKTEYGISFDLYNFDDEALPPIPYRYTGLMFQVAECLSFYGEEQSLDEPFSMITSAAQVPTKSLLGGYFTAVGVHGPTRLPAGSRVAIRFRNKKLLNVDDEMPNLGIRPFNSLPPQIQKLL